MKKIIISLLMIAATLNAMAITYTGKVQVVLRATSNNAACGAVIATSDALNDGLNPMYYAELNDEGKQVLVYVEYEGTRYEHFGSSATTMRNMPLIMKANASSQYKLEFYEMEGTIEIYDKVAGANIDKSQDYIFTIEDEQKNTIIADRFIINYDPTAFETSVTTNEDGWASFAYTADVAPAYPAGLQAYKGALDLTDPAAPEIHLTAVSAIPASEGVFVKGAPLTTYYFNATTAAALSDNDIVGCTTATDPAGISDAIYTLRNVGGVTALYHYEGTAAIPAGKAYLPIPVGSNPAPQRVRMVINEAQGMENVVVERVKAEKFVENGQILIKRGNEVYNLQGQIVK